VWTKQRRTDIRQTKTSKSTDFGLSSWQIHKTRVWLPR